MPAWRCVGHARSVAHQTAGCHGLAPRIDRRHPVAGSQRDELLSLVEVDARRSNGQHASTLLNELCKGGIDLARVTSMQDEKIETKRAKGPLHLLRLRPGARKIRI